MKIAILVIFFYTGAYGVRKPLATDRKYLRNLEQKYLEEHRCLYSVDEAFVSKWREDLDKLSFTNLDEVEPERFFPTPSKQVYFDAREEWLIESDSTSKLIDFCLRSLMPEIVPLLSDYEIKCLNSIFDRHIKKEIEHEKMHKNLLKNDTEEQLPFRMYLSFAEFVEIMFQNRNPDALGIRERDLYENMEYLTITAEKDKLEPTFLIQHRCDWKNARALREASNADARFNEFLRQLQNSVNLNLGVRVWQNWQQNQTLSRDEHLSWLDANQKIMSEIFEEVSKLRTQNKDAQWLCDYATELAEKFADTQANILVKYSSGRYPATSGLLDQVRGIEKSLDKLHDVRYPVVETLINKYENATRCLSAFYDLVRNHQRFDIASSFINERYTFSEIFCKNLKTSLDYIAPIFCKCVGSFCVKQSLAVLDRDGYELLQRPDGTYYIALSQIGEKRRLQKAGNSSVTLRPSEM